MTLHPKHESHSTDDAEAGTIEDVGLIVVHGIGEQGRFEHLDGHVRGIINGFRRAGCRVTVEIQEGTGAAFLAQQGSWRSGAHPAVRLHVRGEGINKVIHVHEVWWADVNEKYALIKQVRFWVWGLSIWLYPARPESDLPTHDSVFPPRASREPPGAGKWFKGFVLGAGSAEEASRRAALVKEWGVRVRLFGVGAFFLLGSLSIGLLAVLLKRLLNLDSPNWVRTFADYVSSVKLYTQPHRKAPRWNGANADFLDTIGMPPRVSIRRRMLRTIADVACRDYHRWYILAHSQGSVVAFNGLMEPAFGWPGYLDEERWQRLRAKGMAGPSEVPPPGRPWGMVPARPDWLGGNEIVYRTRVFQNFRGLLTYGCPLEKFAAIWPATVPVCREPAFQQGTLWINAYDPMDPVSGVMASWPKKDQADSPAFKNIGYKTGNTLLVGHLHYLDCPEKAEGGPIEEVSDADRRLADKIAGWLMNKHMDMEGERFFEPDDDTHKSRRRLAYVQIIVATCLAASGAAFVLMLAVPLVTAAIMGSIGHVIVRLGGPAGLPDPVPCLEAIGFVNWLMAALAASVMAPLAAGLVMNGRYAFRGGPRPMDEAFSEVASPDPYPRPGSLATHVAARNPGQPAGTST